MSNDLINGLFELFAALAIFNHCRAVLKARMVAGISTLSVTFFASWGVWNLHYYPSLDQWYSFVGGVAVMSANLVWIGLLIRYRK